MNGGKFFLDTNIFVYLFDTAAPAKSRTAEKLVRSAIQTKRGVVSYQVVQEFFNIALTRFAKPVRQREAEYHLRTLFQPLLGVHSSQRLFLEAIRIWEEHRFSWYDCIIVSAALEAGCETLYTEDLQSGRKLGRLQIENPFLGL